MRLPISSVALPACDDGGSGLGLRLARVRTQAAVIRTLADHVEALSRDGDASAIADQLIEEMARLGCRLLETAGALAGSAPPEDSGVFTRLAGLATSDRRP
jgi:hypothetical protein